MHSELMKDLTCFDTMTDTISYADFANLMGVSKATLSKWEQNGRYVPLVLEDGEKRYDLGQISDVPAVHEMLYSKWNEELEVKPLLPYTSIELFAGAGGLAIGMEQAGFKHIMLNEIDHNACETLRVNRPQWRVIEDDIRNIDFSEFRDKVDLLTGGFPCQAFSYAGKQGGFNDTRGTLFFELARAVKEIRPKVFMAENVRGLIAHDHGKTFEIIKNTIRELGYELICYKVLKALKYKVPQKRERLLMVAVRNDLSNFVKFSWPSPYNRIMTLRDAFYKGDLYESDVPVSEGQTYPEKKKHVMDLVPMGGDWRDLPIEVQKTYMGKSFYLGGGKTGMARRLSLDEPSLTLTCAPAQKQTERCHPLETRPLTVREYARVQTFPDNWQFSGNLTSQYRQIGNAVPVNMAAAVGRSFIRMFNELVMSGYYTK